MIRWTAFILASLSWLFAFHHHVAEDRLRQWTLVILGLVCGALGLRRAAGRLQFGWRYLLVLIPLLVLFVFTPLAGRPGIYLLIAGTLGLVFAGSTGLVQLLQPASLSALLLGTLLVLQSASFWACTGWMARNPELPYIGGLLYGLFDWLGMDVSYSGGVLFVRMMRSVHEFPLLWEHVALYPMVQIWIAGALAIWVARLGRSFSSSILILTATLAVYAVVRLFVLIPLFVTAQLFVDHDADVVHVELFWSPLITFLSLLPLIPILARVFRWQADATPVATCGTEECKGQRLPYATVIMAAVACFAGAFAVHFWDPGVKKNGRILLDEAHSQWERTDHAYTTDWYGHESGYNYYCMAQYLDHFYDLDFNMEGELTPDRLSQYDVLLLKTPTDLYSPAEIDAIESFVRRGGGLFAFGEHTNVFGSSVALNPVTRRFGIAFNYDSVFDLTRKWEQVHIPGGIAKNRLVRTPLGVHPIMKDLPFFRFAVSSSIATDSWHVRPVIRSTGLWALPIEYAAGNFYPHVEDLTYARFGAFNQTVCTTAGTGRVVAFGDSTVYSNFLAFYPGKPEMLLGAVEWLNRQNRLAWLNTLAWYACGLALLGCVVMLTRQPADVGLIAGVASTGAAGAWLAIWGCGLLADRAYDQPAPHTPVQTVVFDMDQTIRDPKPDDAANGPAALLADEVKSLLIDVGLVNRETTPKNQIADWPNSFELPLFAFTKRYQDSFEIFYQWILRLGYFTTVSFDFEQALLGDQPIVLIEPVKPFSPETLAAVRGFLERGGSMLVLDSPTNADSTANQLLERFDLGLGGMARSGMIRLADREVFICDGAGLQLVRGGEPLLFVGSDEPVLAWKQVGKGQIIAAGLSDRFNDAKMGGSSRSVPNLLTRAVFELEFAIIRGLVEKNLPQQMDHLAKVYGNDAS